jgi:photosystem II stability/assembly factor-like uncharacterized protein
MNLRTLLVFCVIFQVSAFSQVNWQVNNPLPQVDLKSVYFFNTNTGIVCGINGSIYKSSNAGYSWTPKAAPTSKNLNFVLFYSSTNGIAVGDSGTVIYTTDAGESWMLQPPITNLNLRKVYFCDNQNVIVLTNSGNILRSTNSGTNWSIINVSAHNLLEIDRINNVILIGSASSSYFRSSNLGSNWQQVSTGMPVNYIYHIHFTTIDTGYFYSGYMNTYKTINGGLNWFSFQNFAFAASATYLTPLIGYSQSQSGEIMRTSNGGESWVDIGPSNVQGYNFFSLFILNTSNIYIAGNGGRILHHTGGNTDVWNIIGGSTNSCVDVSFINNNTGFIAASEEQFWTTTNSGLKWNIQGLCNNNYFEAPRTFIRSVYAKDSLTIYRTRGDGYAGFGYTGLIQVSNDGGQTWGTSLSQIYAEYYKIGGAGSSILCSVGKIIKNSGSGWVDYLSIPQTNLNDFHFINETTGIILSRTYTQNIRKIHTTTNNGLNWSEQQIGRNINNVFLRNTGMGMICCDSGRVLKTTNFGFNWMEFTTPTNRNLRSVFMMSDNTIWTVGTNGAMLYSINGGINWTLATVYTASTLNKIIFTDNNTGYAVGDYATILKTTDGGLTFSSNGSSENPSSFKVEQNYPNPFNPETSIKFSLPSKTNVKLEIFDVTGKLVEILTDKEYPVGLFSLTWDASNYSSGFYFYKITAGVFTESKKMILLK